MAAQKIMGSFHGSNALVIALRIVDGMVKQRTNHADGRLKFRGSFHVVSFGSLAAPGGSGIYTPHQHSCIGNAYVQGYFLTGNIYGGNMENLIPLTKIQHLLADRKLTMVAKKSGLTYPTVKRVADGNLSVSIVTWQKLSAYFTSSDA